MRSELGALVLLVACAPAVACGGGSSSGAGGAGDCPDEVPATCPVPPPTFGASVSPIFNAVCTNCHAPGQAASDQPLTSYAEISQRKDAIVLQIDSCRMPPAPTPPLTSDERAAILGWIVCGAPDN